jgi:hypothetical protein
MGGKSFTASVQGIAIYCGTLPVWLAMGFDRTPVLAEMANCVIELAVELAT